jgi:pyridoxine 4-dehydrogenase
MTTASSTLTGGTWTLGDQTVTRFGYGAMQLAGPWVTGPPADHDAAIAVLRGAIEAGSTHMSIPATPTPPRITNQLIREARSPVESRLPLALATSRCRGSFSHD